MSYVQNTLTQLHNYYHPLFRQGSAKPLWHIMMGVSAVMYTTSYLAHNYGATRATRATEKKALHEYYEKHGGAPHH